MHARSPDGGGRGAVTCNNTISNGYDVREKENSFGVAATVPGRDDEIGSVSAGMRLRTEYRHDRYLDRRLESMDGVWRPMIDVRWRQFFEGDQRDFKARFDGTPDEIISFKVQGEEDPGGIEVGAGLSFVPDTANRLQFDLRYEAYFSENTLQQDLTGRIPIGF